MGLYKFTRMPKPYNAAERNLTYPTSTMITQYLKKMVISYYPTIPGSCPLSLSFFADSIECIVPTRKQKQNSETG